jgi:hypothetical protein
MTAPAVVNPYGGLGRRYTMAEWHQAVFGRPAAVFNVKLRPGQDAAEVLHDLVAAVRNPAVQAEDATPFRGQH